MKNTKTKKKILKIRKKEKEKCKKYVEAKKRKKLEQYLEKEKN